MKQLVVRILLSVIAFVAIDQVVWALAFFLTKPLYIDSRYYATWSQDAITLITGGHPSIESFLGMVAVSLLSALFFVGFYRFIGEKIPLHSPAKKGLFFGLLAFCVGSLYQLLGLSIMLHISPMIILSWIVVSLLVQSLQGVLVAIINTDKGAGM